MARHTPAGGLALILVIGVVTSGCTPHRTPLPDRPTSPAPATDDVQALESAARELLTTDAETLRQKWHLFRAEQILDQRCMARHGFTYLITGNGPEPGPQTVTEDSLGDPPPTYGITAARLDGVGAPGTPAQDRHVAGLPAPVQDRYLDALNGPADAREKLQLPSGDAGEYTTGGCVGESRRKIYGSVRAALEDVLVPQDVRNLFLASFLSSYQPYLSALRDWQQCMASRKFSFDTPAAAIQALRVMAMRDTVTMSELEKKEADIAAADVACDRSSHLRQRRLAGLAVFIHRQPPTLLRRLAQVHSTRLRAVELATRIGTDPDLRPMG